MQTLRLCFADAEVVFCRRFGAWIDPSAKVSAHLKAPRISLTLQVASLGTKFKLLDIPRLSEDAKKSALLKGTASAVPLEFCFECGFSR